MSKQSTSKNPSNLLENLRKVITLVDQLRDVGLNNYIQLPRIVVLGIQSSGKSSLLEQIVGLDFLPRGDGVVTRRPLELRLSHQQCPQPYAIFEEIKNKKFIDFSEVKQNIISLTDKVAGSNKNIVDKPIILQVYGPNCPDLTLVDLPGITRIPLRGSDQPQNIEEITTNMAKKYCEDPKTIMLCVIAANQDLTTSDALRLAKNLDPNGERTFGVLTKIDIMDRGTNALRMLKGQDVPLKFGYIGVKLRSQQDIKDNITVQKALQQEKEFFASHPVYSSVPGDLFGTAVLTSKLTTILYKHIKNFLPEIMKELTKRTQEIDGKLAKLGPGLPTEDKDKLHFVWQLINEFTIRYKNSISGSYEKSAFKSLEPAGAKIRENFTQLYSEFEKQEFKVLKGYTDQEIQQIIFKYEGDNIPGFLSVEAFYALLSPELNKLVRPAIDCVDETYSLLEEYATKILDDQISKLPEIKSLIEEQVLNVLQNAREQAQQAVTEMLESEQNYIFTNDFKFLTGAHEPYSGTEKDREQAIKNSNILVYELKRKIEHYYKIVVRSIRDNLPKLIGHFLVKGSQNNMLLSLQENIMQNQEYLNIINEPAALVEERQNLKKEIETLKAAQKVIKRDPDLSDYLLKMNEEKDDDLAKEQQEDKIQNVQNQNTKMTQKQQSDNNAQQNEEQPKKKSIFGDVKPDVQKLDPIKNDPFPMKQPEAQPSSKSPNPITNQNQGSSYDQYKQSQLQQQQQQQQNQGGNVNNPLLKNQNQRTGTPIAGQQQPPVEQAQQEKKSLFGFVKKN